MKKYLLSIVFITSLMLSDLFAQAEITSRLSDALVEASKENSTVRTLAILKDQVDISSLDKQLYETKVTLEERAYIVITTLQNKANSTQGALLEYLDSKYEDEVAEFRSFWITNMVFVEASPSVILDMAERTDLAVLDLDAQLSWDKPVSREPAAAKDTSGIEPGLAAINAPAMWALGFTGAGRIVMNDDTGVDVNHPALGYKWRGNNGASASASWFDPGGSTTPYDQSDHGTHTMGTMCGLDPATNDTIGVAPGALWIASRGYYYAGGSIAAWQWAMDPDGNPGTIDDMPDAINNSWYTTGISNECDPVQNPFYNPYLAVEATGIAIIFSAGNEGPAAQSITQPKNTNIDEVSFWATGALDGNNPTLPIAYFSSRGPVSTPCSTGISSLDIKPEASAPGVNVRSAQPGGGYQTMSGTSMAAPHVAGAIALLREAHPTITGWEAKMALYQTAVDLGDPGEDNAYGMGIINVYGAHMSLADPDDPNPPSDFTAYSDYTTTTSMFLSWIDPTTYVNEDPLTSFQIYVYRDGVSLTTVASGVETYTDNTVSDGTEYIYSLMAADIPNDSLSMEVFTTWTAGGSAFPAPPENLGVAATTTDAVLTWTDPTTQSDSTTLDDLDHLNVYRDGSLVTTVAPGVETYTDMPTPGFTYTYKVTAVDNETPANESDPSNAVTAFVGITPSYLVWVHPDVVAGTPSEASGDSLFNSLVANGESAFLTNDLFEFGTDLSVYDGIFVVLGIFSDNGLLIDPEGSALETYLQNGGRLFLEGGDCFNYDPDFGGGYQIRPWFDLDTGLDGDPDVTGVIGLNDLLAFTFAYNGSNNYMDELVPVGSTPVWQNDANTDISGVFNVGFGGGQGRAVGVVPSFGGFVSSTDKLNTQKRLAPEYTKPKTFSDASKPARILQERTELFIKKAAYYPEFKAQRKALSEVIEIAGGKITLKANTQDDLMAAYIGLFTTIGEPTIAVDPMAIDDSLEIGNSNDQILTISNVGGSLAGDLIVNLTESVSWMTAAPTADTIAANQSADFTVSLDATGLTTGTYATTIDITSNDLTTPLVQVNVTLEVMEAPAISVDPTSFSKSLLTGEVEVDTLTISNTGLGVLEYDITIENVTLADNISVKVIKNNSNAKKIITQKSVLSKSSVYAERSPNTGGGTYLTPSIEALWDMQFSFDLEIASGALGNAGAEFDGTYYYTTRWASNLLHQYDLAGNLVQEFSIPGVSGLRDLAFDGTYMYGGAGAYTIYIMDFATQTLIGTISSPEGVRHIAYDAGMDAFWVGNWATDIYLVDRSGATLATIPAATHGLTSMYGSAYDDFSDGGPYLWVFHQGAGTEAIIAQLDLATGMQTGVTHNMLTDFPTTAPLAGGLWIGAGVVTGKATIGGCAQGAPDMFFSLELTDAGGDWLSVDPTNGSVASGGSVDVEVTFDAAGMLGGDYTANILINSNDPVNPVETVTATLHVTGAPDISVDPDTLDFGYLFLGVSDTMTFAVQNPGTADLNITGMAALTTEFTVLTATPFTVTPGGSYDVEVVYSAATSGVHTDSVVITHDAPVGEDVVQLMGETANPPVLVMSDTLMQHTMSTGEEDSTALMMYNQGASTLEYDLVLGPDPFTEAMISLPGQPSDPSTSFTKSSDVSPTISSSISLGLGNKAPWDLQFNMDIESVGTGIAGCEFDGTYFYVAEWGYTGLKMIYKLDINGVLVSSFDSPTTVTGIRDMAYDGTNLFGSNASTTVYEFTGDGVSIGTFSSPVNVRTIAYDPRFDGFWVSDWATDIVLIDRSGNTLTSIPAATHGLLGMYGCAYDDLTPGGPYLWVFDQGSGATFPQYIHQFDLNTLTPTGVSHDVMNELVSTDAIAGGLFITTDYISGKATIGGVLQDTPTLLFGYELADHNVWVTLDHTQGTISPNDSGLVWVYWHGVETETLNEGYLGVYSNDPVNPVMNVHLILDVTITGIDDLTEALPTKYALHQNFPNPFNPSTTIKYDLKAKTDVKLTIYNVLGQKVRTLVNTNQAAGYQKVVWDGLNDYREQVASGIYIYRIEANDFVKSRKMIFMK